jgi:hypothetical protein
MFVDHVRCLHDQIQTVLKMRSIKKQFCRIIADVIYIFASCDQLALDHTGIHNYAFYLTGLSS